MRCEDDFCSVADIEMPEKIIDAASNGNLVIFAGAGVSMQKPKPLSDFETLTNSLFKELDITERVIAEKEQPCETRLEKLVDAYGSKVYEACAYHMSEDTPSALHRSILRCFPARHPVRIVTTNFDKKFESAAEELGMKLQEGHSIYFGPALPLGNQFSGLVHLHGVVSVPQEMILTETDFGGAYVTKAWASRFLVDLFNTYTVLFVGYSLNDILVRYIARSISPDSKDHLFVLVRRGDSTREIESLGITPVPFHEFKDLPEIFTGLSKRISYSLYDKTVIVRKVAEQPDQSSSADWRDIVRFFGDPSENARAALAKAYAERAIGFEAIRLLVRHGISSFLFEDSYSESDAVLARWAAESFALSEPLSFFQLEQEKGEPLSSAFMAHILAAISNPTDELDDKSYNISLALWALKLDRLKPKNQLAGIYITEILNRCTSPQVGIPYIQKLFEAYPSVSSDYLDKNSQILGLAFTFGDGFLDLSRCRDSIIALLRSTPLQGLPLFINIFETYHDILSAYQATIRSFDSLSFRRAAIEEHPQNFKTASSVLNSLIDITRDIGLNVLDTEYAEEAIWHCLDASSNLVQRIGIYLLSEHRTNPNLSIDIVLSNRLLENHSLRHEVFGLLYSTYPHADTEHRTKLINSILEVYPSLDDVNVAYGRFRVLAWLAKAASTDKELTRLINEIHEIYPDFELGDHPDFLTYISGGQVPQVKLSESNFTAQGILDEYTRLAESDGEFGLTRLQDSLCSAMADYPVQGISVIEELLSKESVPPQMLDVLVSNIRWDKFDSSSAQHALNLVLRLGDKKELFLSALDSLNIYFSPDIISHSNQLADCCLKLLDACSTNWGWLRESCSSMDMESDSSGDWMFYYMNSAVCIPIKLYSAISITPQYHTDLRSFQTKTSDFIGRAESTISEDSNFGRCICTGIGFNLEAWLRISPDLIKQVYYPILSADHYNAIAAWDGISYSSVRSPVLWDFIKDDLVSWIEHCEGACNERLVRLLTSGAILHENASDRQEIIKICANSSPQIASACLQCLTEWMGTLSNVEQKSELEEWLDAILPHFAERPQFQACASTIVLWLDSDSALKNRALEILLKCYHEECKGLIFPQIDLAQLGLEDESLAKFLIFFLRNTDAYTCPEDTIREAMRQIEPSIIDSCLFNELRDQSLRQQLELPTSWRR